MKKGLTITIGICLIIALTLSFAGCIRENTFKNLEKAFADSVEVVNSFDNANETDLAESNVNMCYDTLETNLSFSSGEAVLLSEDETTDEGELTLSQKVDYILDSLQEIKDKQDFVNEEKSNLRIKIQDIKANIKTFKNSELELTESDKNTIKGWIGEIYAIRANLKSTIGEVYLKMKNLRGHYNRQDIDYVISTLDEVNENMDVRKTGLIDLQELATEIDGFLSERLDELDTETDTGTDTE